MRVDIEPKIQLGERFEAAAIGIGTLLVMASVPVMAILDKIPVSNEIAGQTGAGMYLGGLVIAAIGLASTADRQLR